MDVLITGGRGFLGSHLSAYLATAAPNARVHRLGRAECELARGDVAALLHGLRPDIIFHLAGALGGDEATLTRDNDTASARLFEAIQACELNAIVVLGSSTAVYGVGGTPSQPVDETTPPQPRGAYALSKLAAEQHALRHAARGGRAIVARITNPIGAGMSNELLCGVIAAQVLAIERGEREAVLRLLELSPVRDFIHADDCAAALWQLVQRGQPGAVYNVAQGRSASVQEVVDLFLQQGRVRPIEVQATAGDAARSPLTEQWVSHARLAALGWRPRRDLAQAVADLLAAGRD